MDCPYCRYPLEEGASFCGECGRSLPSEALPPDPPAVPGAVDDPAPSVGDDLPDMPGLGVAGLPDVGLPAMPTAGITAMPGASLPAMPKAEMPAMPDAGLPAMPKVDMPAMPKADLPAMPGAKLPPLSGAAPATQRPQVKFDDGVPFSLELDTMLSLQEKTGNSLRILFTPSPSAGRFSEVSVSISSDAEWFTNRTKRRNFLERPYEFLFLEDSLKAATSCPCDISVSYVLAGRRHFYDGTFDVAVLNEVACRSAAQITLQNIYNVEVDAKEASRVRVEIPDRAKREVEEALRSREQDPLKAAEELVNLGVRKYRKISISRTDGIEVLQKPPQEAVCREIQLDFGYGFGTVQFFTDPVVSIGHSYEGERLTDIVIDPPDGLDAVQRLPYEKMSRGQCILRSDGDEVVLIDGRYRSTGVLKASTNGTYLDGEKAGPDGKRLPQRATLGLGTKNQATSLDVALVTPKAEACQRCRLGGESRGRCRRCGQVSTNVVLHRRDGVSMVYVTLWSCIDVGVIYKGLSGLEIFYDHNAFAWRWGTKRGWLVPGREIELSHFRPIVVSNVWDDAKRRVDQDKCTTKKGDSRQ